MDNKRSTPLSRCRNIFATGVGVSSSRLATDTRTIDDTRRHTRLAVLMDGKRKNEALAACTAFLAVTMIDPSEEEEADNTRAWEEGGTQRDDDPYTFNMPTSY